MIDLARVERYARRLDWRSGRAGSALVAGAHGSKRRGQGAEFRGYRPYEWGDDVRQIDWNVTARQARPFVKTYDADLSSTIMLLVDVSPSLLGAGPNRKARTLFEIVALFALVAARQGDRVGALFFGGDVERAIRPGTGMAKAREIIRAAEGPWRGEGRTSVANACAAAHRALGRASVVLLISDFYDDRYARQLGLLALRHDVVGMALLEPGEAQPPFDGLFHVTDAESGRARWVDGASPRVRTAWSRRWSVQQQARREAFSKADVPCIDILVDRSYLPPILRLCKAHGRLS